MTNTTTIPPAQVVINEYKGVRATSRHFGYSPGAVSRWCKPKAEGGCDGRLPGPVLHRVLELILAGEVGLTVEDVVRGRRVPA